MRRMGIYTRLSMDRSGEQTATDRQEADCRRLADARDWKIEKVYSDVDLSAYHSKKRPGYEQMLLDLEHKRIEGVLVWKLDRLVRSPAEFERFWETCDKAGAVLASYNELFDTTTEFGLAMVRILVVFARLESANISVRIQSAQKESVKTGKPLKGGKRPYGYEADKVTVKEDEAAIIREIVGRVLVNHEALYSIARDLNEREIPTAGGGRWATTTIRTMLKSPRLAGLMQYRGEVLGEGQWDPIITLEERERLLAWFSKPSRRWHGTPGRKHLLSGLAMCGVCGYKMYAGRSYYDAADGDRKTTLLYRCQDATGRVPACGKVVVTASHVDDLVSELVLGVLRHPNVGRSLAAESALRSEEGGSGSGDGSGAGGVSEESRLVAGIDRDRNALVELAADYYENHLIGRVEFLEVRERIEQRLAGAQDRLAQLTSRSVFSGTHLSADDVRALWDESDVGWRHQVISTLITEVRINPSPTGGAVFDPSRVEVVWRESVPDDGS